MAMFKDTYEEASTITDLSKYYLYNINGNYKVYYKSNSNAINQPIMMSSITVDTTYDPVTEKMDRLNFADLETISNYDDLKASYEKELAALNFVNTVPVAPTTMPNISTDTAIELASTTLKTVQDVKNLFTTASTSWSKEAKLYFVWKKVRETSYVELTRAALEELWNVNTGTEIISSGTATTTVPPTTVTERLQLKQVSGVKQAKLHN
jgi:hypothetical protein